MKTVKPLRVGMLTRTFEHERRYVFVVSPIVCFALGADREIVPEVDMWKAVMARLGEGVPLDESMPKSTGELLVTASACAPGEQPTASVMVHAQLGAIRKQLRVTGDRFWLQNDEMSRPAPFAKLPITWANAFGGKGFDRNPLGKGFAPTQTPHGMLKSVPNVEDPRALVDHPGRQTEPAGFGGYDFMWPQRSSRLGTYDARWFKEQFPGLASDIDWAAFNVAPLDQRAPGSFVGDEAYELGGMHPTKHTLSGQLPRVMTRAFVTRRVEREDRFEEIATRLDTVHLFPDIEKGVLVFRGLHAVGTDDASDIKHLVLACEDLDVHRPIEHYQAVLERRLDKKTGALHAFRDRELMPVSMEAMRFKGTAEMDEMKALLERDKLLTKGLQRNAETQRQRAYAEMRARGVEPPPPEAPAVDEPDADPDLDQIPEVAARADALIEAARAQALQAQLDSAERVREQCARAGIDPAPMLKRRSQGGPPRFTAEGTIEGMRAGARPDRTGAALRRVNESLTPELLEGLRIAEARIRDLYRMSAHEQEPADPMDEPASRDLRAWVQARWTAGRSLARADLTGADLSGLDLTGADLREAWLERAVLRDVKLAHADLTGAVLAHADLTGADLTGVRAAQASFGAATLTRARFEDADLSAAILARASARDAVFDGAQMHRADLRQLEATGATLRRVKARESMWVKVALDSVDFSGCELVKCLFAESQITRCNFEEADMEAAVLMATKGDGSRFTRAKLRNLRVVHGSSLAGCDFGEADLARSNLRGTSLAGARFNGAAMDGADLSECDLTGAVFHRAVLREGRLVKADLTGAMMVSVNAMSALLTHAVIQDADFTGANLFRADMLGVRGRPRSLEDSNLVQVRHVQRNPA